MEVLVLAAQARVLMWVGFAWLALGLWQGLDPATVAWRAALGALAAMWVSGWLLRIVVKVMNERITIDMAERQLAEEKKAAAESAPRPAAKPARPATPERR